MTKEELKEFVLENFAQFSKMMRRGDSEKALEIARIGAEKAREVLGTEGALQFIEEYEPGEFVEYAKKRNESRYH